MGELKPEHFFCFDVSEIASCEADIKFFAERHHPDTRKWFLNDFHRWFENPEGSRAYVLLGDAGVGKSVMAGVLAQKSRTTGKLAAAYFCRNDDGTRNNPRYLLGTIACELCKCNDQYGNFVGGEGGIRNCLGRSEMGIQELFTKLLQEPLAKCSDFCPRKLIIIDALDETKDESRGEFLDLIMHRFLMLPKWLVFFITSRPVDTVQLRLKNYHPCIKICLGNSENFKFYQQHELDIRLYLEKSVDFSRLPYSAEDVSKKCNGLFLFAYCIARVLKDQLFSGKMGQLTDLFPDIGEFFLQNFKRIFHKVGEDLYTKLLGCALAAPSPLPVSFITYILQRENSGLDEQEVIDAFSTFLVVRTSDQTFAFLHSLIPSWLTVKKKSSVRLFVDRNKGGRYLRDIISEVLSAAIANQQGECPPFMERDVLEYCDQIGVRLLCDFGDSDSLKVVFSYATNYQVIARRLKKKGIEIYSIIGDLKFAVGRDRFTNEKKGILQEICLFLESNVYVLLQSPHLLQCCLREASKTVQENLVFTESIGATKIEHSWLPFGANEIPKEIVCFAFSPDKKVIAGASGKSISFFDACMLKLVQGPFTVTEMGDSINHLKFSPDGKFLFFGRLDKWFSMKEGCVKDFPQFANNKKVCYKWISFLQKPPYITVQGDLPPTGTHFEFCLINIFCWWATYELRQMYIKCGDSVSIFDRERQAFLGIKVLRDLLNSIQFSSTLLKILLDKLRLQKDSVWNVSQLCPNCLEFEQRNEEKTLELVRQRVLDLYPDIFEFQVWNVESGRPVLEEALFKDWDNFFLCHVSAVAKSGLPILLELLKEKSFCTIAVANLIGYLFPSTLLLMQSKLSVSQETVRYILSTFRGTGNAVAEFLKGTVIRSGNLFVRKHKETLSSLRDVPKDLGQFLLLPTLEGDVNDTSISSATVLTFLRELRKTICEGDIVPLFPVQSVVFSQSGGLVACHLGPKLLIYKNFGSFSSLWYEDQCECDSCHSVFSPDSTLLLHCIQNRNDKPRFQVWNVFSRALSVTFDVPAVESLFPPVDCCCLSSDNTKLIVCGGFSIEIWEYDASPCRLITRIESPVLILNYNKFTYCTVSPETNLLACCITDRIALCPMNTPTDQSIRLLPLAHLGKVEFCQFVKGGHYLISYGVDGNVFLWDLNSCVAITYANVCQGKESIVGLSRSCEGDTFTFLTSSGRFGVLTLCGLEHSILPKLPTLEVQSEELMSEESCGQQREQYGPIAPTHATHDLNVAAFLEEMEFMCDSEGNSESSDDCDDVETLG